MKKCTSKLTTLAVSMIAMAALTGCLEKPTDIAGGKLIDFAIDGIGKVKAKMAARIFMDSEITAT